MLLPPEANDRRELAPETRLPVTWLSLVARWSVKGRPTADAAPQPSRKLPKSRG
jgi:hypothetical protein